jgi:hypothetical protein
VCSSCWTISRDRSPTSLKPGRFTCLRVLLRAAVGNREHIPGANIPKGELLLVPRIITAPGPLSPGCPPIVLPSPNAGYATLNLPIITSCIQVFFLKPRPMARASRTPHARSKRAGRTAKARGRARVNMPWMTQPIRIHVVIVKLSRRSYMRKRQGPWREGWRLQ